MKSIFILHEGNEKETHDNQLICLLMKNLKLDTNAVSFFGMGCKSNFFKEENYPKILKDGVKTGQVEKVLFIVDSDYSNNDKTYGGYINTENELNKIITKLNFQDVSKIHIMYDPTTTAKTGYLESFLLSTIPEDRRKCINEFLGCSGFIAKEGDKSTYKRVYESIAYPFHPFRFDHPHFNELKTKLTQLFIESE